jgi:hypothetical protein
MVRLVLVMGDEEDALLGHQRDFNDITSNRNARKHLKVKHH